GGAQCSRLGDPEPESSPVGEQWRRILEQIIISERSRTALQERGSLARPGEGQSLKIVVNGGNHSSHHAADQNMNEQPIEQVLQNISRRHPSSDKIEVENGESSRSPQSPRSASNGSAHHLAKDSDLATDRKFTKDEFEFMKSVHQALIQQLSTHGIILTLLASITFVVFLQPPGNLESAGIVRSKTTVQWFLCFSSVSFMCACAGLLIVWIGSASLLRPKFFDFEDFTEKFLQKRTNQDGPELAGRVVDAREGFLFDSIPVLCKILQKNLHRVKRLRMYMALSFTACIAAFICAGLAITDSSSDQRWYLIGGICVGGFPLVIETLKYLADLFHKKTWLGTGSTTFKLRNLSLRGHKVGEEGKDRVM
ncbi:hypothetical protein M758_6G096900, partial [Ceratodon purpureus]